MKNWFSLLFVLPFISFGQDIEADFPDVEAQFPGGAVELQRYVVNNIQYPDSVGTEPPSKIYCSFVVEKDGTLTDIQIMRPNDPIWDAFYVELIQGMPKWTPAEVNGKAVRSRCRLPIIICYQ